MKFLKEFFKKKAEKRKRIEDERLKLERKRQELIRIKPLVEKLENTKIPAYCSCNSPYLYYVKSEYETKNVYKEKEAWWATSGYKKEVIKNNIYYNCNNCNKKYKYDCLKKLKYDIESGKIIYSDEELSKIKLDRIKYKRHEKMERLIKDSKQKSIEQNIEFFSKLEKFHASEIMDFRIYTEPYHFLPIEYSIEIEKERKELLISHSWRMYSRMGLYKSGVNAHKDYIRELERLNRPIKNDESKILRHEMTIYCLYSELLENYNFLVKERGWRKKDAQIGTGMVYSEQHFKKMGRWDIEGLENRK